MFFLQIKKVKIVTNNICYGPEPLPDDEVEQHLTISANGTVSFTGYKYGDGRGPYEVFREKQFSIEKALVKEIMNLFSQYLNSDQEPLFATDIGTWEMTITDKEDNNYNFFGALFGRVTVGDIDLTHYLREHLPIDDLLIFDSLEQYDDDELLEKVDGFSRKNMLFK